MAGPEHLQRGVDKARARRTFPTVALLSDEEAEREEHWQVPPSQRQRRKDGSVARARQHLRAAAQEVATLARISITTISGSLTSQSAALACMPLLLRVCVCCRWY